MFEYKVVFAFVAGVLGVVGYAPYIFDIYRGKTKPHAFTWLVWVILGGIAFSAQVSEGAGPGKWLTLTTASISALIFIWSLFRGVKHFARFDWMALSGAAIAILLWAITGDARIAVILTVIIDVLGTLPLIRHAYLKPYEETASMFVVYFFAWIFSLIALNVFTLTTTLYAGYSLLMCALISIILLYRRHVLAKVSLNAQKP